MEMIRLQGRTLSDDDLKTVRALIDEYPQCNRTALSVRLCQLWNWRNEVGRPKDMAARTLLLKLQARGWIRLPPPQRRTRRPCAQAPLSVQPQLLAGPEPVDGPLASLQPVRFELAHTAVLRRRTRQLLAQYHYRGFHGAVGENVQYLVRDAGGAELAVMVFGAAAWKVALRDEFIGWSAQQRQEHLGKIVNQQRFLIVPWVRVPHLASHLLALATRRLSQDWQDRYGHRVWLVESFVEKARFAGTAYKAAGWICLGQTRGRTRQDRDHTVQTAVKAIWVRPLHPQFRQHLVSP